jgi:hypothetical protein
MLGHQVVGAMVSDHRFRLIHKGNSGIQQSSSKFGIFLNFSKIFVHTAMLEKQGSRERRIEAYPQPWCSGVNAFERVLELALTEVREGTKIRLGRRMRWAIVAVIQTSNHYDILPTAMMGRVGFQTSGLGTGIIVQEQQ